MKRQPLVSVIITTKNEEEVIEKLLKSVVSQSYSNKEIIIVDNKSTDKTLNIAKRYTTKIFTKGPERSAQRNFGSAKAKGEFLLFLDADMVLDRNVIKECVLLSEDKSVGGCIIPEKTFGKGFWAKVKSYERSFYIGDPSIEAARFYKKKVFDELGKFDEKITGAEDWDLSDRTKKKKKLCRISSMISHNEGTIDLLSLVRKKYYYAKNASYYLAKNKTSVFSAKTLFFLRKSFYKNPKKIILHPILFCAMIVMLSAELLAGFFGYISHRNV